MEQGSTIGTVNKITQSGYVLFLLSKQVIILTLIRFLYFSKTLNSLFQIKLTYGTNKAKSWWVGGRGWAI